MLLQDNATCQIVFSMPSLLFMCTFIHLASLWQLLYSVLGDCFVFYSDMLCGITSGLVVFLNKWFMQFSFQYFPYKSHGIIFLLSIVQVAAYDTVAKKMAFFDPSRSQDFLFISGTKVYAISDFSVTSSSLFCMGTLGNIISLNS